MTIEAPFHRERARLPHERHFVDTSMARRTAYAFTHMNAVVEIHKLGQVVDASPRNGTACPITFPYWLKFRADGPHLRMAVHADFGGRDIRE